MYKKNKKFFLLLFLSLLCFATPEIFAQEGEQQSEQKATVNKKQKKADKKKAKQKSKGESIIEKGMRRHEEIQTKEVRKRMKQSAKKAERNNHNRRDPFFKRLFTKKKRNRKWL